MQDTSSKTPARHYTRSSSFVMAMTFTALCGATLIVLAYFGYYFARGHFIEGTQAVIDTEIKYISRNPEIMNAAQNDTERLYAFFGPDGARPADIPADVSLLREGIVVFNHPDSGKRYAAKIHTFDDGRKLLVGVDITSMTANYDFMLTLSMVSFMLVAFVIAGSFTISVFVVRGTNDIADTARDIMETGDLTRRIDLKWRWDDLSNMADTLNLLFDRIETLMKGVRQVSDNIAHDLRTPLTRMKVLIDRIAEDDPANEDIQKLGQEATRLLHTFNALLRISRIESEKRRSHFKAVDLAEILNDVTSFYEPLAEEKSIKITSELAPASIQGDRDLIFQAFANILDNAVKYTPQNGTIKINLERAGQRARIEIEDSGTGIPESDIERIFERFYRCDQSRSSSGIGLGLSLVAAVIDLHGGNIKAENTESGFRIITVL